MSQSRQQASDHNTTHAASHKMRNHSQHGIGSQNHEQDDPRFQEVQAKINIKSIASLASSVRQGRCSEKIRNPSGSQGSTHNPYDCVVKAPHQGSYNIAYPIEFDDGVSWIIKIPAHGHVRTWDNLAADALTSEALTMTYIRKQTTVPVPTVHHFNASLDNDIGCPYILMDLVRGTRLQNVWFAPNTSVQRQDNARTRTLQTLAIAMAELSQLRFSHGGSLSFDLDGNVTGVRAARTLDTNSMIVRRDEGLDLGNERRYSDDLFCEKGPLNDPYSSVLFMLDRQESKQKGTPLQRGLREYLRLCIRWAVDHLGHDQCEAGKFALAHPDLDLQNIYVLDDGTLSGIIDWDGVAAVPSFVGPLRFPSFLLRDWELTFYNWDLRADEQGEGDRTENSPDELISYRLMYAQFFEAALTGIESCHTMSLQFANITRCSIVTGCLDLAANDSRLIPAVLENIFEESVRAETEVHTPGSLDTYAELYMRPRQASASGKESECSEDEMRTIDESSEDQEVATDAVGSVDDVEDTPKSAEAFEEVVHPSQHYVIAKSSDSTSFAAAEHPHTETLLTRLLRPNRTDVSPAATPATVSVGLQLAKSTFRIGGKSCRNLARTLYRDNITDYGLGRSRPECDSVLSLRVSKPNICLNNGTNSHAMKASDCCDKGLDCSSYPKDGGWQNLMRFLFKPFSELIDCIGGILFPYNSDIASDPKELPTEDREAEYKPASQVSTYETAEKDISHIGEHQPNILSRREEPGRPVVFPDELGDEDRLLTSQVTSSGQPEVGPKPSTALTHATISSLSGQPGRPFEVCASDTASDISALSTKAVIDSSWADSDHNIQPELSQNAQGPLDYELTAAGQPVVISASHMTADGKPYPRNKPCHCGSRHKFKKCCGKVEITVQREFLTVVEEVTEDSIENADITKAGSSSGSSSSGSHRPRSSNTSVASLDEGIHTGDVASTTDLEEDKDTEKSAGHEVASQPISTVDRDATGGEEPLIKDDKDYIDNGNFNMNKICVALGSGNLDEARCERLKKSFETLLDWTMGKW